MNGNIDEGNTTVSIEYLLGYMDGFFTASDVLDEEYIREKYNDLVEKLSEKEEAEEDEVKEDLEYRISITERKMTDIETLSCAVRYAYNIRISTSANLRSYVVSFDYLSMYYKIDYDDLNEHIDKAKEVLRSLTKGEFDQIPTEYVITII